MGAGPYLNKRFFSLSGERLGERVLLILARRAGRYVAGAVSNFIGAETLYGRNWGCVEGPPPSSTSEVCYYQAIDFAIANGPEAGRGRRPGRAQALRGYRPVGDLFRPRDRRPPGLRRAVADYLVRERGPCRRDRRGSSPPPCPFKRGGA